jgi:hypothetical protein
MQNTRSKNTKSQDANFPTGSDGLIAVDKIGNQILFLVDQI